MKKKILPHRVYIVVFDYTNCRVDVWNPMLKDNQSEDIEGFLAKKKYNIENIYYMSSIKEIPIWHRGE